MKNFGRVLRLALRYRVTVAASVVSALVVAFFWGANITAVYPFVKVVFQGQSLQQWVDDSIDESRLAIDAQTSAVADLERKLAAAPVEAQAALRVQLNGARARLEAEQLAEGRYVWLKPYIDDYLPHDPFKTLLVITLALVVGTCIKDVFLITNSILTERLAQLATFDLRKQFYRRTLRMDLATFGDEGTSDLMSRFTYDMDSLANGVSVLFGKLVREPLKMIACLIGAAVVCWRLLLLSLVIAPLAAYLINRLAKSLKRANRRAMEEMALIYGKLEETFRGIKIVKAFTGERRERRRFHQGSKAYFRKAMRIARYDALAHPMTELMGILTICLALAAGAWLLLTGETHVFGVLITPKPLDLAQLLVFYGLLMGTADPMRKFSDVFNRLQRAVAAADRIFDRLDRVPQVRDPERPVELPRHHRELTFDNVVFGYRPDAPILNGVSLTIPFGQTVAIVGPNGCGKSTLANLVPRFYDVESGCIRLDGVALTDVRLRALRSQIGIVTQETLLFDDTVYNNILYGRPDATSEEVLEASRRAFAHDFISSELPDGYETVVGTLGGRLSGGQRQRIALARAILRDPAIIILDEATSQIDLESEQAIHAALETFLQGRTSIVITHRLSILALADQIVVMQSGRIVDTGRHQELMTRCPLYRRLHQVQFDATDEQSAAA
jgi:ATP-binding cassette subfamily B protein/subfamily B ATP-binding cassette protein MsbA